MSATNKIDPGPGYRLYEYTPGNRHPEGVQIHTSLGWYCARSPIPVGAMPSHPEVYRVPAEALQNPFADIGPAKDSYTVAGVQKAQKSYSEAPQIQDQNPRDSSFLRWIADRLVHVHKEPENVDYIRRLRKIADTLPAPVDPAEALQDLVNMATKEPNGLKPFTPNKYTRYVPALDGTVAPVDVYGVSAAFDIRSQFKSAGAVEAILHGRKKLLAPGQRGAKDALQDLKEARDSLNRAIALEEAALERGNGE